MKWTKLTQERIQWRDFILEVSSPRDSSINRVVTNIVKNQCKICLGCLLNSKITRVCYYLSWHLSQK